MKKIFSIIGIIALVFLFSCSNSEKDSTITQEPEGVVAMTFDVEIPIQKVTEFGETVAGPPRMVSVTANVDFDRERIISFSVAQDFLNEVGMTSDEFNKLVEEEAGFNICDDFDSIMLFASGHGDLFHHSLGSCADACNDAYTDADGEKIKGRGRCKWGCVKQYVLSPILSVVLVIIIVV